jgi:hypothetical protein
MGSGILLPTFVKLLEAFLETILQFSDFLGARKSMSFQIIFYSQKQEKWVSDKSEEYDGCSEAVMLCWASYFWTTNNYVQGYAALTTRHPSVRKSWH